MTAPQISTAMQAKIERLAEMVPTFSRGRSKVNGQEFVIVPGSKPGAGYFTNGLGCTCKGYDVRGYCTHALAVNLVAIRASEARIAAAQRVPCSVEGCSGEAFGKLRRCIPCFDAHVEVLGI